MLAKDMKAVDRLKQSVLNLKGRKSFSYLAIAKQLTKQGYDVINFGVGQPDVDTPKPIVEEAKKALDEGFTKYTEVVGIAELREAITEYLNTRFYSNIKPSEVLITPGALPAIFLTYLSYIESGDEVVIIEPSYPPYAELSILFNATPVYVPLRWEGAEEGFKLDIALLEESINKRTKLIIVNSPHNPSGYIIPFKHIEKIVELAEKVNAVVLVDEVYNEFVYNANFKSVLSLDNWRNNVIYVNSFSKTFSMTGWRLGYLVAHENIVSKLTNVAVNIWSCAPSFVQKAGVVAMKRGEVMDYVKEIIELFRRRRDFMISRLRDINGVEVWPSQGTFYLFPYIGKILTKLRIDDEIFAEKLLWSKYVAVIPGSGFPNTAGRNFIRLSFAIDIDLIDKGTKRIKQFIEEFEQRLV